MKREPTMAISQDLQEQLAACAHAIWCEQMRADGWTPGETFDDETKVHDWLVPFASLPAAGRDRIASWIVGDEIPNDLVEIVQTATTWTELTVDDIKVGTAVRLANLGEPVEGEVPHGTVTGWEPDGPRLNWIEVRWDDGDIGQYASNELELAETVEA